MRTPEKTGRLARPGARGFTLVELMIVMAIAGVMLGVALPAFSDFMRMQRVKNASFDVFSALVYARSEAVTRNAAVSVTPVGATWDTGWTVTTPVLATPLRTQGAYINISMTGPANITFNGSGRATVAGAIQLEVPSQASTKRCVTLDLSGRPVGKKGAC